MSYLLYYADLHELCLINADVESPTTFTCQTVNRTSARCYVDCKVNWGVALLPRTEEIYCHKGQITPVFVPECSGKKQVASVYLFEISIDHVDNIPTMQYLAAIPRNSPSMSDICWVKTVFALGLWNSPSWILLIHLNCSLVNKPGSHFLWIKFDFLCWDGTAQHTDYYVALTI